VRDVSCMWGRGKIHRKFYSVDFKGKKLLVKLRPTGGNIIKVERKCMKILTRFIGLKMWTCRGLLTIILRQFIRVALLSN